jgi:hypothetical protein
LNKVCQNKSLQIIALQGFIYMGDTGLEHPPLEQSKTPISTSSGAKSDAHDAPKPVQDPDLAMVVERWPNLPEHIKAAIKALTQTHNGETK